MKLDPTSHTQTDSEEMTDLIVKAEITKHIINLCHLGLGNGFKGKTTKA